MLGPKELQEAISSMQSLSRRDLALKCQRAHEPEAYLELCKHHPQQLVHAILFRDQYIQVLKEDLVKADFQGRVKGQGQVSRVKGDECGYGSQEHLSCIVLS